MRYTHSEHSTALHFVRINPLNAAIVRFGLTIRVHGYRKEISEEMLSLYAALLLTGTAKKSKADIEAYLKRYGIQLSISSGAGSISFTGSVRKERVKEMLQLVREILTSPKIETLEFTRKKKLALEDNRESRDDAKLAARIAFSNMLYDKESVRRELTLDEARISLNAIILKHLAKVGSALLAGEWFLSVVCDADSASLFKAFTRIQSKTAHPVVRVVAETRTLHENSVFLTIPGKSNVELRIGNIIPITPDHPDYLALEFGMSVLGHVGGFSGRLMSTVREKEGLTYGIYASIVDAERSNTVHWNIFTFFTGKDLAKGVQATRRELTKIVQKGITKEELDTFKEILSNQKILLHESNSTRLKYYHRLSLTGYTEDDAHAMYEKLAILTREEVGEALKKHIDPKNLIIAGAGPVTQDGKGITT
jgi:zinc protease